MPVFMIHCDVRGSSRAQTVVDIIKAHDGWTQLSHSLYLVQTEQTVEEAYVSLARFIDHDDSLYVIPVSHPYRGFGQRQVNEWLDKRLSGVALA